MNEPLADEEFEGLKKYYKTCTEPKADVFALIATVDELKEENAKLKEQLDLKTPREALIQLQEENEKLKAEVENLTYTIRHLRSSL
jgi:FtsZ-binding cell division protein ZapB